MSTKKQPAVPNGGTIGRRLAEVMAYLSARAAEDFYGRVVVVFERGLPVRVEYTGSLKWIAREPGEVARLEDIHVAAQFPLEG